MNIDKFIELEKPLNSFINCDCMELMAQYPDKYFELAIIDPPYGSCGNADWDKNDKGRFGGRSGRAGC